MTDKEKLDKILKLLESESQLQWVRWQDSLKNRDDVLKNEIKTEIIKLRYAVIVDIYNRVLKISNEE